MTRNDHACVGGKERERVGRGRHRDQLAALCATLRAEGREIDVLVNNAGGSNRGLFEAIDDDLWQRDIEVKLFAAIRLTRFVLPGMKARRWGRILNVVSVNGKAPPAGGAQRR